MIRTKKTNKKKLRGNLSTISSWSRVPRWAWPREESGQHLLTQEEPLQCHSRRGRWVGGSWTNHTAAASQPQCCCCLIQSQGKVLHSPSPSSSSLQETPHKSLQSVPSSPGQGGEGLAGMRRRCQQACPSYLVEEVIGWRLLGSSPALHHLHSL